MIDGMGLIPFQIGLAFLAVEHLIGTDVDHGSATSLTGQGDVLGAQAIDSIGQIGIPSTPLNIGVGSGVGVGGTGVGVGASADYYQTVAYPHGPSLCAIAESLQARCDSSCALFGRMLDVIEASGGGTSGIVLHLDSLHTTCMEWLAYEDSVAATASDLRQWLSEASSPPVPPARELMVRIWPTPCGGSASLSWSQPGNGRVNASLYDLRGRAVATLFDGAAEAGMHLVKWHPARAVSPGVYVLRLRCDPGSEAYQRVVVTR